ncbi:MAG: DUF1178 family protein [bacterium]
MIIYELFCEQGHGFEGWFQDGPSFQEQMERGLIQCPICGTSQVSQRLSTGGTIHRGAQETQRSDPGGEPENLLRVIQKVVEKHFQNVGSDFAKVALRMHYGVEEPRNIRGTTTEAEEKMLRQEGVEFFKLALPDPDTEKPLH